MRGEVEAVEGGEVVSKEGSKKGGAQGGRSEAER